MRTFDIYKVKYNNGDIKLYKQLKDFYNEYVINTDDKRSYDNFKYTINNNFYNTDKKYKHKNIEYEYKLNVDTIEKHNFKDFLQDYLKEYKVVRQVKDSEYTKSTAFYNKIYNLAKYRVECN
tara:strand:+ start:157 stop:522 length:366 start_codon:yes stop_codon:yes gene_type:complete